MKPDAEIRPIVWPEEEPELPARPAPPAASATQETPPTPPAPTIEPPSAPALPEGILSDSTHAFVWEHTQEAAAVLRTLMVGAEAGPNDGPLASLSSRQLAAAFLCGLGSEIGARVLHHLSGEVEAAWVGRAVAEEPQVSHSTAVHALDHVRQRIEAGEYLEAGGAQYAEQLLAATYGRGRAHWLLRPTGTDAEGFAALRGVAPEQAAPFISHEHPQTIALLLSQLDPTQAAGILAQFPERMQSDVSYRMATMESISPRALMELELAVEAALRDVLAGNEHVGGIQAVADVINRTGSSVEKNVLDHMDQRDPEVAEAVRNLMFTFADIGRMLPRDIATWTQEIDPRDMAVALKGAEEPLRDTILDTMSEEARTAVTDQMASLGPLRVSEVEETQLRCVQQVRRLEEQGRVTIVRGEPETFL